MIDGKGVGLYLCEAYDSLLVEIISNLKIRLLIYSWNNSMRKSNRCIATKTWKGAYGGIKKILSHMGECFIKIIFRLYIPWLPSNETTKIIACRISSDSSSHSSGCHHSDIIITRIHSPPTRPIVCYLYDPSRGETRPPNEFTTTTYIIFEYEYDDPRRTLTTLFDRTRDGVTTRASSGGQLPAVSTIGWFIIFVRTFTLFSWW